MPPNKTHAGAEYNLHRPHSRLGWMTPAEYADTFSPRRDLPLRSMTSSAPAVFEMSHEVSDALERRHMAPDCNVMLRAVTPNTVLHDEPLVT